VKRIAAWLLFAAITVLVLGALSGCKTQQPCPCDCTTPVDRPCAALTPTRTSQ
jgi:hypothetical protein